jgi:hypothetical protein
MIKILSFFINIPKKFVSLGKIYNMPKLQIKPLEPMEIKEPLTDKEVVEYYYTHIDKKTKWIEKDGMFFYYSDEHEAFFEHSGSDMLMGMRPAVEEHIKKLEREKNPVNLDLNKINGNEIIDFLNKADDNEEYEMILCDCSVYYGTYQFDGQKVHKNHYSLYFTGGFSHWGEVMDYSGNEIKIKADGEVKVELVEPFEGDGSDEMIEEALTKWLKTHTFDPAPNKKFDKLLTKAKKDLETITFEDTTKLQKVVETLNKALTYMK